MNLKTSLLALVFVALAFSAAAAEKPQPILTVAVCDFTDADKNSGYGRKVTALITASLSAETNFTMVERAALKKALGEQAIGISGMVNSDTAVKIGQITGANVLVGGQAIKTDKSHLVLVANIIGTGTGRLFAVKVEGPTENFMDLSAELSRKIAQKIRDEVANFVTENKSHDEYLDRIVNGVKGTNRPTVSVGFHLPRGANWQSATANGEMGILLQKAGFTVVDSNSDRKPDIEITGVIDTSQGLRRGELFSFRAVVEAKVQERRTGNIIAFDRQASEAVDVAKASANRSAQAKAVDGVAERILPLLAR